MWQFFTNKYQNLKCTINKKKYFQCPKASLTRKIQGIISIP